MKKVIYKWVMGLFLLVFTITGVINVFAVDDDEEEENKKVETPSISAAKTCDDYLNVPKEEWSLRYGASVKLEGSEYVIKVDENKFPEMDDNTKKALKKMEFELIEINYYDEVEAIEIDNKDAVDYKYHFVKSVTSGLDGMISGSNKKLTISNSLKISDSLIERIDQGGAQFVLRPVEQFDPLLKNCNEKFNKLYLQIDSPVANPPAEEFVTPSVHDKVVTEEWVDCDNKTYTDTNSFEYKFCESRKNAINAYNNGSVKYVFDGNAKWPNATKITKSDQKGKKNTDGTIKLKCDYKTTVDNKVKDKDDPNYDYYTNKEYIMGENTITKNISYTYHTEKKTQTIDTTCDIKCEEVVVVEYGPPIASKAGFCFQYQVKVTSRINCKVEKEPEPPKAATVCTPKPQCEHSWGVVARGGPSDEFDNCVEACDGGKYTDKCTNKCYKEVYEEDGMTQSANTMLSYEASQVRKGYESANESYRYTYNKSKKQIKWYNGKSTSRYDGKVKSGKCDGVVSTPYGSSTEYCLAYGKYDDGTKSGTAKDIKDSYYHQTTAWGRNKTKYNYYVKYDDGIPTTKSCSADCYWIDNTSKECNNAKVKYLNHPAVYDKYYDASGNETDYDTYNKTCKNDDPKAHTCGNYKDSTGVFKYYDSKGNTSDPLYNGKNTEDCQGKKHVCTQTIGTDPDGNSMEKDMIEAEKAYVTAKNECKAAASCSTKTAEFTISASYTKKGEKQETTIYFPYTKNNDKDAKDTIENRGETTSCTKENPNSTIIQSAGCYNCKGSEEDRLYMTEWSFPGYWVYSKTAEISYDPIHNKQTGWEKADRYFCLPDQMEDVNAKWYNYYQAKRNGNNPNYSYNNAEYMNGITCPDGSKGTSACDYRKTTFTDEDEKDINYNINATARKFGMYNWDIDISCFYAVNSQFPKEKASDNCDVCKSTKEEKRVREVDLTNLFPDKDAKKVSADETGRTPGFNWSDYAKQVSKDTNYQSVPSTYAKWVQKTGKAVYSDEYLDYEVTLTKDMINKLKKEGKEKYTEWSGTTTLDEAGTRESALQHSVVNYQSKLIRSEIKGAKYPTGNAIKCNNMKNYSSTECQEFKEEGK